MLSKFLSLRLPEEELPGVLLVRSCLSPETVFTKAGQKRVLQIMWQFGHPSPIGGESVIKRTQLRTTEL